MAHILIDLRWMIPGYTGGIEILARTFVETLLRTETRHGFTLLLPSAARYDFDLQDRPNFHLQISDGPISYVDEVNWRINTKRARQFETRNGQTWINHRRSSASIALSLQGSIHPDLLTLKNLALIPDLQHEVFPEFFDPHELENRRRDIQNTIANACRIITISQFSRQALLDRFKISPDRVIVAYPAAEPIFNQASIESEQIWNKYGLNPGKYLFYPAHTWPHKNHRLIFQALAILKQTRRISIDLVCSGAPKEAHQDLVKLSESLGIQEQFRFLGYCPRPEIPALYKGATALVLPSLFEGFGMPVLEAMQSGCPVICSNATSLPEVAGNAACYIDPDDPANLAQAIHQVLTNHALREELIINGRRQAAYFTWEQFSKVILDSLDFIADQLDSDPLQAGTALDQASFSVENNSKSISNRNLRIRRARDLIYRAIEHNRQSQYFQSTYYALHAFLIGPDVFFNLFLFPQIRDKLLRPILRKFSL